MNEINDINEIIRQNLITLRKEKKLTQLELANLINYSDKAISRWETGEVTPDVATLARLADVYGVNISVLLEPYNKQDYNRKKMKDLKAKKKIALTLLIVASVWLISVVVFMPLHKFITRAYLSFIWAIPTTFLIALIFNAIWGKRIFNVLFSSALWTLVLSFYLTFIRYNLYLLFVAGAPVQIGIILMFYIISPRKRY